MATEGAAVGPTRGLGVRGAVPGGAGLLPPPATLLREMGAAASGLRGCGVCRAGCWYVRTSVQSLLPRAAQGASSPSRVDDNNPGFPSGIFIPEA